MNVHKQQLFILLQLIKLITEQRNPESRDMDTDLSWFKNFDFNILFLPGWQAIVCNPNI